jgi:prepilin-type N-terminal cleavage/methylation domain-containing protein
MRRKSGFTLIELLVVMAIIAVLAAMIVPKVGGARARAQRLSCASNMRGIVRGFQMYEEDWSESAVQDPTTDTTLDIFGSLYYLEDDKFGDKRAGLTSLKIYNCPASDSTPPSPNDTDGDHDGTVYKEPLELAGNGNIDYGVVTVGNTPSFKDDPDKNAILIELELNHNGRNIAFWDSTVSFIESVSDGNEEDAYPNNVDKDNGMVLANAADEIYAAGNVIDTGGKISDPLDTE